MERTFVVTPSSTLSLTFDLETRLAPATARDTLKGMFFKRVSELAQKSGVTWDSVGLRYRPAGDRYAAFSDYPVADYFRWVAAVGRALHPRMPISEAMRRVGSRDFAEFAESRIGSVMLSFTGNAKTTLAKSGTLYTQVLKGATVESEETPDGVLIRYRNYPGPVECYPIGTIESTCRHYGADYSIEVAVMSPLDADYRIRVSA
jgi:uncharacterized protein (TIGR02265 family)